MSKKLSLRRKECGTPFLVSCLQKKGIQLVAVDFDQTLLTIHSGGVWKDSVEKLIEHVRPCIHDLIDTCLSRDMYVCIVTFFSQPWVIKEMMKKVFKKDGHKILVQANTPEFRHKHNHDFLGKEAHISAIVTELYNRYRINVRPEEIILFDDDRENTDMALKFGHLAYLVEDSVTEQALEDYAKTLDSTELRKSWVK